MCEAVTFEMEEEQQDNYAEIVALNDWKPGKIKKVGKHFLQKDGLLCYLTIPFVHGSF